MGEILAANPHWVCAATKIFSQASGHKIVALLERWVGAVKDGKRHAKKMTGATTTAFPLARLGVLIRNIPDTVAGFDRHEVETGGGVPSCGRCQSFLPAYICEQTQC
jgi:hypothetical protein